MPYLSAPNTVASMAESPRYEVMGVGETDDIFLVGHADGLSLHTPYRVTSMKEAVKRLNGDTDSPLLRGSHSIWSM